MKPLNGSLPCTEVYEVPEACPTFVSLQRKVVQEILSAGSGYGGGESSETNLATWVTVRSK